MRPTVMVMCAAVAIGCGGDKQPNNSGDDMAMASPDMGAIVGSHLSTKLASVSASSFRRATGNLSFESVGGATATGLKSLKYFITGIGICQQATVMGTAFDAGPGCIELYHGAADAYFDAHPPSGGTPDYAGGADYARTSTNGFVDLLDPVQRATLSTSRPLSTQDVGDYKYGYIYWQYPIKVTAEITSGAGATILYTHDGTSSGGTTTATTALTSGPAEEAVVTLGNGGSWFKFQTPFSISAADLEANKSFVLDLTFDPDGIVQGATSPGMSNYPPLVDAAHNTIMVPMLDLSPVAHGENDKVQIESYLATVDRGSDRYDVRVELYSIVGDPQRTIYGVNIATLVSAQTVDPLLGGTLRAFFVNTNAVEDGGASPPTVDFLDWQSMPILAHFARGAAVDDVTSATIPCTSPLAPPSCSAPATVSFTLKSLNTL